VIDDHEPVSFRRRALPPRFTRTETAFAPGATRPYREAEWRDALVVVEEGEIELECLGGGRRTFRRGDVLCFAGLPLRALRNPGTAPALLVAVSRVRSDECRPAARSEARDARIEGDADDHHRYP
jgi:quercetin dioxygenase-like cupin family protein